MTEAELKEFLDANKADIQQAIKTKLIDQMLNSYHWGISEEITKTVNAFVAAEIIPEVKKYLADQKGPILEAALVGAADIGNTLAKALVENTAKNLASDSYKFRSIMKALFE